MNLVKGLKQCHYLPKDHLPSLNQSGTELYLLMFCFVFNLEMTNVQRLEKTQGTEKEARIYCVTSFGHMHTALGMLYSLTPLSQVHESQLFYRRV